MDVDLVERKCRSRICRIMIRICRRMIRSLISRCRITRYRSRIRNRKKNRVSTNIKNTM